MLNISFLFNIFRNEFIRILYDFSVENILAEGLPQTSELSITSTYQFLKTCIIDVDWLQAAMTKVVCFFSFASRLSFEVASFDITTIGDLIDLYDALIVCGRYCATARCARVYAFRSPDSIWARTTRMLHLLILTLLLSRSMSAPILKR